MSVNSTSLDDLLIDALTLRPFVTAGEGKASGGTQATSRETGTGPLDFLTATGQPRTLPGAAVRPLTTLEARARLTELLAQPRQREQLLRELGRAAPDQPVYARLAPLLAASDAQEFTDALMTWAGTTDPEALEGHLETLSVNMAGALEHLRATSLPAAVPRGSGSEVPGERAREGATHRAPPSALLLGFLSLSLAAEPDAGEGAPADHSPVAVTSRAVTLPAPALDFSHSRLERVLGRQVPGDS